MVNIRTATRWMRELLIMTLLAAGTSSLSADDDVASVYEKQVFPASSDQSLPYRLLRPLQEEPGEKYPLVLFLHGAGERGNDNEAQLLHVLRELAAPALRERFPAFVVAPQCPKEKRWVEVPWEWDSHMMPETPSEPLQLVMDLLKTLPESLPIDRQRIYYTGLSMGGFGVWDLLQRQPEGCAGAVIICGGGDPALATRFKDVPIWAFHGDRDRVVKLHRSVEMVEALRRAGGRPILTIYPDVQHNSWTATAQNRQTWDWLFAQARP